MEWKFAILGIIIFLLGFFVILFIWWLRVKEKERQSQQSHQQEKEEIYKLVGVSIGGGAGLVLSILISVVTGTGMMIAMNASLLEKAIAMGMAAIGGWLGDVATSKTIALFNK